LEIVMSEEKTKSKFEYLPRIDFPDSIYIGKSPIGGYGIFAKKTIQKETLIDTSVFVFSGYRTGDSLSVSKMMKQWLWPFPCKCDKCKVKGNEFVFGSGTLSLYNHSLENFNVGLYWKPTNRIVEIRSKEKIKGGQELLINYGKNYQQFGEI